MNPPWRACARGARRGGRRMPRRRRGTLRRCTVGSRDTRRSRRLQPRARAPIDGSWCRHCFLRVRIPFASSRPSREAVSVLNPIISREAAKNVKFSRQICASPPIRSCYSCRQGLPGTGLLFTWTSISTASSSPTVPTGGPPCAPPLRRAGCSGRSRTRVPPPAPPSPRGCCPSSRRTSAPPRAARSTAAPVLVPLAHPARGEDEDDDAAGRVAGSPDPRRGGGTARYACKFKVAHPATVLPAHAVLVGPDVPVGHFGTVRVTVSLHGSSHHSGPSSNTFGGAGSCPGERLPKRVFPPRRGAGAGLNTCGGE